MATRIKYVKTEENIYITEKVYFVGLKRITASFNLTEMQAAIITDKYSYKLGPYKSVSQIKKAIKQAIEAEGFKFEPEVRNKRAHKQAIQKALGGENE
jgi:hypothetical protein